MALGTILAATTAAATLGRTAHSIFSDDDEGGQSERGQRLRSLFEDRLETVQSRTPTETTSFRAQTGALRGALDRQAETDEEQAAARGLSGSAFEVSQDATRTRQLARGTRQAAATSASALRQQEQSALQGLLRAEGLAADLEARRRRAEQRRQSRLNELLSSGMRAAALAAGGGGTGGGGGGAG